MQKPICKTGIFTVKKSKPRVVLPVIKEFVNKVNKEENGIRLYVSFQ